jgi:hypothetical protein
MAAGGGERNSRHFSVFCRLILHSKNFLKKMSKLGVFLFDLKILVGYNTLINRN